MCLSFYLFYYFFIIIYYWLLVICITSHFKINFGLVKSLRSKKICTLKHMFAYKQFQSDFGDAFNIDKGENQILVLFTNRNQGRVQQFSI